MRAFVAAFPSVETRLSITQALRNFRQEATAQRGLRWIPAENLHVTLRFLGDVDAPEAVAEALSRVRAPRIACRTEKLVAFPSARRPSVFALTLSSDNTLETLAQRVNVALSPWGEPDKPFRAHLTVARCRRRAPRLEAELALSFPLDEFGLYGSETRPEGARYRELACFPLGN